MSGILDYLSWRGDIPLESVPFCDVDGLILSQLAYTDFDVDGMASIGELCEERLKKIGIIKNSGAKIRMLHYKKDAELLSALASSKRFSSVKMGYFEKHGGKLREEQFAAMTVFLPDNTVSCVFRGTDWSLVGWKEDFNMAYRDVLPSQQHAVKYLERIAAESKGGIRLMGHSKGGNLAVFAAAFCNDAIKERITDIVSFDGPGFSGTVRASEGYKKTEGRVRTFMPRSSIVGALFSRTGKITVIESRGVGLMQHIPYNWEVMGAGFIPVPESKSDGLQQGEALNEWLYSHTPEERLRFIDALWALVKNTGADELFDLLDGKRARSVIKSYAALGENERKMLMELFSVLITAPKKRK